MLIGQVPSLGEEGLLDYGEESHKVRKQPVSDTMI